MSPPPLTSEESIVTTERFRLLSWGYYFSGGMGAVFASFLLMYAVMFGAMSLVPESEWGSDGPSQTAEEPGHGDSHHDEKISPRKMGPPLFLFRMLAGVMVGVTLLGWTLAGLTLFAGWCISRRKHRGFIFLMAGYNVLWIPYGTLLGVCTFIVLSSREGARQFQTNP